MTEDLSKRESAEQARSLRKPQTVSEGLLWSVLRGGQLCGLRFRRQHPIRPWIVDFACLQEMLVVEIDGGYHEKVVEKDLKRQRYLESMGWKVIRFRDREVEEDVERVARAIAAELNLEYEFLPRRATGSGMRRRKR